MARYRMTPKRRTALRKAQAASARKRRHGRNRRLAVAGGVTVVAATAAATYYGMRSHRRSKIAAVRERGSKYRGGPKLSFHRGLDVLRVMPRNAAGLRTPNVGMERSKTVVSIFGAATAKRIAKFDEKAESNAKYIQQKRRTAHRNTVNKIKYKTVWVAGVKQVTPRPIPKRNRFTRAAERRRRRGK